MIRDYDVYRLHANNWPVSGVTQWVVREISQKSKVSFLKPGKEGNGCIKTNTMVFESDTKLQTEQQLHHQLYVLHCGVVFVSHTLDDTAVLL